MQDYQNIYSKQITNMSLVNVELSQLKKFVENPEIYKEMLAVIESFTDKVKLGKSLDATHITKIQKL